MCVGGNYASTSVHEKSENGDAWSHQSKTLEIRNRQQLQISTPLRLLASIGQKSWGGNTGGHIIKIPSTITRHTYKLHIHARENVPAQAAQLPAKSNIEECLLENRMLKAGDFGSSVRCVVSRKSIARTCRPHQTHSCTRTHPPYSEVAVVIAMM